MATMSPMDLSKSFAHHRLLTIPKFPWSYIIEFCMTQGSSQLACIPGLAWRDLWRKAVLKPHLSTPWFFATSLQHRVRTEPFPLGRPCWPIKQGMFKSNNCPGSWKNFQQCQEVLNLKSHVLSAFRPNSCPFAWWILSIPEYLRVT